MAASPPFSRVPSAPACTSCLYENRADPVLPQSSPRSRRLSAQMLGAAVVLTAVLVFTWPAAADFRAPVRVLILGNTIGSAWNAPSWTEQIGRSAGHALAVQASMYHYVESLAAQFSPTYKEKGLTAVRAGGWSFIILEENPYEPVLRRDGFFQSVTRLAAEAKARGAETILVEPFALDAGSVFYGEPRSGGSPERMQALLREACNLIAARLGLRQARVGEAFAWMRARYPEVILYENDKIHPSACGSFLEACTLESVLDSGDAADRRWLPPRWVGAEQAQKLREAASAANQQKAASR